MAAHSVTIFKVQSLLVKTEVCQTSTRIRFMKLGGVKRQERLGKKQLSATSAKGLAEQFHLIGSWNIPVKPHHRTGGLCYPSACCGWRSGLNMRQWEAAVLDSATGALFKVEALLARMLPYKGLIKMAH